MAEETKAQISEEPRRPYEAPALTVLGTVEDMTSGDQNDGVDDADAIMTGGGG